MSAFRQQLKEAWDTDRARYWKRQKLLLRSMVVGGRREIPTVPCSDILVLFATSGPTQIHIEAFLNEYEQMTNGLIDLEWEHGKVSRHPTLLEYAEYKGYNVVFNQGDIVQNPHYDPSVKCHTIFD